MDLVEKADDEMELVEKEDIPKPMNAYGLVTDSILSP